MRSRLLIVLLLALVPIAFLTGYRARRPAASVRSDASGRRVLYYVDPMNPSFRSSEPGIAPCGMPLEPVYEGAAAAGGSSTGPGLLGVSPERQQLIGIRVEAVQRATPRGSLRLLGRAAVDEARLYRLFSVTGGWVREAGPATTGSRVRSGEVLAAYYAPEAAAPQQSLLYQVETHAKVKETGSNPHDNLQGGGQLAAYEKNIRLGRQSLLNLGFPPQQVEEIVAKRQLAPLVEVRSPADGLLLARNVSIGQRFEAGTELFTVADLRRVWVLADASGEDAARVKAGTRATVVEPASGRRLEARVSPVLPRFDAATRTLKVRLEVDNPGYVLRPDMFVDVELPVAPGNAITVPKEAVIDSGTRRVVYVQKSEGLFEPRRVETGWREGDQVEIVSGLAEGEKVVTSGNFLLDSESRMRAAGQEEGAGAGAEAHAATHAGSPTAAAAAAVDPMCGMGVDAAEARFAGRVSRHAGRDYYFCSPTCKKAFDAEPAKHAKSRS